MSNAPQQTLTPEQAMAQAVQRYEAGDLAQCEKICRRILQARPDFHYAYFQLALVAVQAGKLPLAADLATQAAQMAPGTALYFKALGEINRRLGRLDAAIAASTQAVVLAPKDAEIRYNLGLALADAGRLKEAEGQYRLALDYNPSYGLAANNLGTALENMGDTKEAEKFYRRAVALNARHAEAQNNLGALQSARGDLDGAIVSFEAAIEASPSFVHPHYNLSSLKKYKDGDPHLLMLEGVAQKAQTLPAETRLRFWFAIGKAREDVGRYDEAFQAYAEANRLKRATFHYNPARMTANVTDIIGKYTKDFAQKPQSGGSQDETPVFIVGMPRSGTTLIEQILASHPDVFGAGELKDLSDVVAAQWPNMPEETYVDQLLTESDAGLTRMGENYISKIRALNGDKKRITDKMPGNFYFVGLIYKILPNAKIIHSMRDPMDTCFSNYARLFNETMPFAYDMAELLAYHDENTRLMNHWKSVLPAGTILEVQYENVVADLEAQSRRMVAFCGLPWNKSCLAFHKNKREVKTASVAQVRQPIYKSSVKRWERFKTHLAPFDTSIQGEKK